MYSNIKIGITLYLVVLCSCLFAQQPNKRTIHFSIERVINAPVSEVWKVVGEDFGAIANSHPKIVSSNYNQGHITGGENASRTCNYNEKGTKYLKETQIEFDPKNYTFKVRIDQSGGLPINPDYSFGIYKIIPIDTNSCKLIMSMELRTKPAFLGGLAKKQFKRDIADYLLAVEHHVLTGENVNKDNFKKIKQQY